MQKEKNIVLIGMPGSGKSTVGVVLAKLLGMNFVDGDILITQREGCTLQEILDERGLEAFLRVEEETILAMTVPSQSLPPAAVCRSAKRPWRIWRKMAALSISMCRWRSCSAGSIISHPAELRLRPDKRWPISISCVLPFIGVGLI